MDFKIFLDEFIKKYAKILTKNKKRNKLSQSTFDNLNSIYKKDNDGIVFFDQFGVIKYSNDTFYKILKNDKNHEDIKSVYDVFKVDADFEYEDSKLKITYSNGFIKVFNSIEKIVQLDGNYTLFIRLNDITDNEFKMAKFRSNLDKTTTFLRSIDDLVFSTDENLYINFCLGNSDLSEKDVSLLDNNIFEVFPTDYCNDIKETIKKGGSIFSHSHFNGTENLVFETKIIYHKGEYFFLQKNISSLKSMSNALNYLSNYDVLSGFLNWSSFVGAIQKFSDYSYLPIATEKITIKDMKNINDKLGYEVGDKIIKNLSEKIKSMISGFDLTVRVYGEVFAVVLPNTSDDFVKKFHSELAKYTEDLKNEYTELNLNFELQYLMLADLCENYPREIEQFLR